MLAAASSLGRWLTGHAVQLLADSAGQQGLAGDNDVTEANLMGLAWRMASRRCPHVLVNNNNSSQTASHDCSLATLCRFCQAEQGSGGRPSDNDVTDASLMGRMAS